ncbi:MAG: SWIM zinc finger domain-containing protein [Chloroflexi bacterium]|nr:SWIM zinc finger domain-containing protein [Chloroflexota bacterium]
MTQFKITEADVRNLANSQSFDRGHRYYRSKAVSNVVRRGNMFTAEIEGSSYAPYQVQITLNDASIETTFCSCPYDWGGICKHIVATLLVLIHDGEKIEKKPELASLLADLTADQLRQALLGVAAAGMEFAEAVEREVGWLQTQPATLSGKPATIAPVDINAVRREIHKDFRLAGHGDPFESGYYDEYAAPEMNPDLMLQPHLEKVTALLDAGDVDTAVSLITAIINSFIDGLTDLDDYIYEYNEDVFSEATVTMGALLAEVLLSLDMQPDEQVNWLDKMADWEDGLGDMDVAKTAVEQGWTYPPLVAAMGGNITEKGAWEGDAPYFADELALARLRILARQNRQQEYIYLAEAEGQAKLAITMLATSGQTDKAVAEAKEYLSYPSHILSVAQALVAQGAVVAALDVAAHGFTLEQESGMLELARWAREMALPAQDQEMALQSAQAAFAAGRTLADYTAVQQIAGDQWLTIKPTLLKQLSKSGRTSHKIDIYLHENMLAEAMKALDKEHAFVIEADLRRVVEATRATSPDWGIRKYREKAEAIMDGGQAKYYDTAVSWLRDARDIYQQHKRQAEWQRYLNSILETHHRKYKLVPMLRSIR